MADPASSSEWYQEPDGKWRRRTWGSYSYTGEPRPPAQQAPWQPRDPAQWEHRDPMHRMRNLSEQAPAAQVHKPIGPDRTIVSFISSLRCHALQRIDRELLEDRRYLWDHEGSCYDMPPWWTLSPDPGMAHWQELILGPLGCDERSVGTFQRLLKTAPEAGIGYMECCRVLAHCLKDKQKDPEDLGAHDPRDWSRWMSRACEEAIEALQDPSKVRGLRRFQTGKGAWENYVAPAPSSSSSSGFGGPAPGYSKGFERAYPSSFPAAVINPGSPSTSRGFAGPAPQGPGVGKGPGKGKQQGFR